MLKAMDTVMDLVKAGFTPIDAAKTEHFAAVGRLLLSFSTDIDLGLKSCLQSQMNNGEEAVTRIVLGEMRIGDVMQALRRIAETRKVSPDATARIEMLFQEIQVLRNVRDKLAHRSCMVAGEKLAFHNAFLAKTDAAIEVDIYTLAELVEFSDYAARLGQRVLALRTVLVPVYQHPRTRAYLDMLQYKLLQDIILALKDAGKLEGDSWRRVHSLAGSSSEAMTAYVKAVAEMDGDMHKLQEAASSAVAEFSVAIAQEIFAGRDSLQDIPIRLRKKP